jgi:hypothetical protein
MQRTVEVLHAAGTVVEVRILTSARATGTLSGYFTDPAQLAQAAARWSGKAPIYITLNPCDSALLAHSAHRLTARATHTTADHDIQSRRWLPLDFDPARPTGISSTDTEHEAALVRMRACHAWLQSHGWPSAIEADSGNGAHLLPCIDLPNDDASRALVQRCLEALAFYFSDHAVGLDLTTYNAGRIWKCYGTLACKGDNLPDRPHRMARLLSVPSLILSVSQEQLEVLAALAPQPSQESRGLGRPQPGHGGSFDLERWITAHGLSIVAEEPWQRGGYRGILNPCPWNTDHTNRAAYIVRQANGAIAAGCHHNGCHGKDWHALRDLYEPGWRDDAQRRTPARPARGAGTADEHGRAVDQRRAEPQDPEGATAQTSLRHDQLPWINASNEDLPVIAAEAWDALLAANHPPRLFLQGRRPARLERDKDHAHITVNLSRERLRYELARAAKWYVPVKVEDHGWTRKIVLPPLWVVDDMLARPDPPFPPLTRVTETPAFTPDGSLQTIPGYHPASQTFYAPPPGLHVHDVPARPSKVDLGVANALILEVLADFPFVSQADEAHAIALFLLPYVRDLITGPTPNHLIEAPTPGSGKGWRVRELPPRI